MHTVYFDSPVPDDVRRRRLYDGQIFVYKATPSSTALCEFARQMIEDAFKGVDPRGAQYEMDVETYVSIVAPLKPQFIHAPESKRLIQGILAERQCSLETTYLDVPRLRMVTSDGYLTAGVGYAHHAHRDTWYSAPLAQINWWLPIYEFETECSMAFHQQYWNRKVKNGSSAFNYYAWNTKGRADAAKHIKADTRQQPKADEPMDLEQQLRIVCGRGDMILFSAAQMHSTVPNTAGFTRYSVDFRTVNLDDLKVRAGAPNLDSACTGTSLRDFMRGTDLARLPEDLVAQYDSESETDGVRIYQPELRVAG
jgi:hypothetical protein